MEEMVGKKWEMRLDPGCRPPAFQQAAFIHLGGRKSIAAIRFRIQQIARTRFGKPT